MSLRDQLRNQQQSGGGGIPELPVDGACDTAKINQMVDAISYKTTNFLKSSVMSRQFQKGGSFFSPTFYYSISAVMGVMVTTNPSVKTSAEYSNELINASWSVNFKSWSEANYFFETLFKKFMSEGYDKLILKIADGRGNTFLEREVTNASSLTSEAMRFLQDRQGTSGLAKGIVYTGGRFVLNGIMNCTKDGTI